MYPFGSRQLVNTINICMYTYINLDITLFRFFIQLNLRKKGRPGAGKEISKLCANCFALINRGSNNSKENGRSRKQKLTNTKEILDAKVEYHKIYHSLVKRNSTMNYLFFRLFQIEGSYVLI